MQQSSPKSFLVNEQNDQILTESTHDSEYFRRRAAEARAAAFSKDYGHSVEVAGDLALAYAALARRRAAAKHADSLDKPALFTAEPA